jgi:hypothetical protein
MASSHGQANFWPVAPLPSLRRSAEGPDGAEIRLSSGGSGTVTEGDARGCGCAGESMIGADAKGVDWRVGFAVVAAGGFSGLGDARVSASGAAGRGAVARGTVAGRCAGGSASRVTVPLMLKF